MFSIPHTRGPFRHCSIISDTKWSSLVKAGLVVSFPLCWEIIFGLTIWDYVSALVTNSHSPSSLSIHWWSLPEAVTNEGFLIESFLLHLLIDVFSNERTYPVSSLSSFTAFSVWRTRTSMPFFLRYSTVDGGTWKEGKRWVNQGGRPPGFPFLLWGKYILQKWTLTTVTPQSPSTSPVQNLAVSPKESKSLLRGWQKYHEICAHSSGEMETGKSMDSGARQSWI